MNDPIKVFIKAWLCGRETRKKLLQERGKLPPKPIYKLPNDFRNLDDKS